MNEKIKAINPQIVVHGTLEKPYYEIFYYDISDNQWHIGYSSYNLQVVKEYLDSYFEIIDAEPVVQGKWVYSEHNISHCSECGFEPKCISQYCPNCGANMEED